MLDDRRNEFVDREERVRMRPDHVAQVFLISRLVEITVEQLLRQVEGVLVVLLRGVLSLVDEGDRNSEPEFDAERTQSSSAFRGLFGAQFFER